MSTRSIGGRTAALLLLLSLATACRDEMPTAATLSGPSPAALAAAPSAYTAIDLGTLGGWSSWATAVNIHGEVAGIGYLAEGGRNAFRWTVQGGMEDLGSLGGVAGEDVDVTAINDAGVMVGASSAPGSDYRRAFSLTRSGEWRDLGLVPGQQISHAEGINNRGEIVGTTNYPYFRAFFYRPETGMEPLEAPDPAMEIIGAFDINDSSQIVGRFWGVPSGAYVMKFPGEMQIISIDSVPYWDDGATPVAINNAGQVVGYWGYFDGGAFVWSAAEGMRFLPAPGARGSGAFDIDEQGRIAGAVIDPVSGSRAALWSPDGAGGYTLTLLGPGEAWSINAGEVVGISQGRATLWSLVVTAPPPPTAPTGVAALAVSYRRIDLSWTDASGNETSFQIWRGRRATDGSFGSYQRIGSVGAGGTGYPDTTVAPGATYRYQVRACNGVGCGASDAVTATVPPLPAPGSLRATFSAGRVVVAWTYTSGARFRVRRSDRMADGTFAAFRTMGEVAAGATAFADTAVAPGHTYRYVVQACYGGECASSGAVPVDVPLRPAPPAGLSARAVSGGRIDLAWTDAAINERVYLVRRTTRNADGTYPPYQTIATLRAGSTSYSDLAVEIGGVYHYRVAACNATACASSALPSSGVTVAPTPAAPTGVTARAVLATRVDVGWTDASTNETSFRIRRSTRRPDGTFAPFQVAGTVGAGVTAFSDGTVAGGNTYRYLVQACRNASCASSPSVPVTVRAP